MQRIGDDGTLYVDIVLPDGQNVGDALCTMGVASRAASNQLNVHRFDVTGRRPLSSEAEMPPAVMPSSNSELINIPDRVVRTLASLVLKFGWHVIR